MKDHLNRALEILLVPIAAAIVFFEEVLLRYLGLAMVVLARWEPVARVELWLTRLPPWAALAAFVAPSALVFPIKLGAVWLLLQGKFFWAGVAIGSGKIVATALVARLYKVLRPTLVRLPWYLGAETSVFAFRDRIYAFVRALSAWEAAARLVRRAKAWLVRLVFGTAPR